MKIDTTTIAGYETMTAEEKLAALEGYEMQDKTNEEETLNLKKLLSERNSQIKGLKDEIKSKMSETERLEAERAERTKALEEELKALKRDKTVSEYTAQFLSTGYSTELAKTSAEAMADGNVAVVFNNLKAFIVEHDKGINAEALRNFQRPASSSAGDSSVTKEQFEKMGYEERVDFFEKFPELYTEFTK